MWIRLIANRGLSSRKLFTASHKNLSIAFKMSFAYHEALHAYVSSLPMWLLSSFHSRCWHFASLHVRSSTLWKAIIYFHLNNNDVQLHKITELSSSFSSLLPLIMQIDFILSLVNLKPASERRTSERRRRREKGKAINLEKLNGRV